MREFETWLLIERTANKLAYHVVNIDKKKTKNPEHTARVLIEYELTKFIEVLANIARRKKWD